MDITTKFDLGDTVFVLQGREQRQYKRCEVCSGSGWVRAPKATKDSLCPEDECRRGQVLMEDVVMSFTITSGTVGDVTARRGRRKHPDDDGMFDNHVDPDLWVPFEEDRYMLHESGIGSGTLWNGENLFASRDEAVATAAARGWLATAEVQADVVG